jgi:hypothetical protein
MAISSPSPSRGSVNPNIWKMLIHEDFVLGGLTILRELPDQIRAA